MNAYSDTEKQRIFDDICELIISGKSLRYAVTRVGIPAKTFFVWIRDDDVKSKQYAQATIERAELMFEDMLDIADDSTNDFIEQDLGDGVINTKVNNENIQRSRLRVDTRKWALSKLMPKKYGDKLDLTTDGEKLNQPKHLTKDELIQKMKELDLKV